MRSTESEYNHVAYPSTIYSQTHPDRFATIATLFGLEPADVRNCRVLELGCGDGANLIAMAHGLPGSRFTGIDIATEPIRRGEETVKALGLKNLDLLAADILQTSGAALGAMRFDYVIAHGLYSWAPAPVRDRILELCRDCLAPHGVAFISYNAHPGNHLRDLARGMMQYHARNFPEPLQQIRQARGLLKLAASAGKEPALYHQVLQQEFERCRNYTDAGFYHDDLSSANHPVYFWQFAEHAKAFGLQFLAEAELSDMEPGGLASHVLEVLDQLDPANLIAREQYIDFFKGRAFRHTLICRDDVHIERPPKPERVAGLLAAADVHSLGVGADGGEDFEGPHGAVIGTKDAAARAALNHLSSVWPRRVSVSDLVKSAASTPAHLLDFLKRCYQIGFIHLHTWSPPFVTHVSERPVASPVARHQAAISNVLPTMRHTTLKIEGPIAQKLVTLLDGTHDRATLLEKLKADEPSLTPEILETLLQHLARSAVLIG